MKRYSLVALDIAMLSAMVLFVTKLLGIVGLQAVVAIATLHLMLGCVVTVLVLSTGLLGAFQQRYRRGVIHAILLPWSTITSFMMSLSLMEKERREAKDSTKR